jgi:hypothetical protein
MKLEASMHNNTQHLHGGLRAFAAAAAIASLAAFGCTTNRTPGNGQPSMTAPATPSSTPGTSSGTSNPPMASAYSEGVSIDRANESAAIMAAHQRERFLGTINPSDAQPNPMQPAQLTGQFIPPSAYANPQATVNASISSDPIPVITGDGGGGVVIASAGTTSAATVGATTAATAAPISATTAATATPTTAAIMTTPTLANATATPATAAITATRTTGATILTPTLTSILTPSPTRAANPPLGSLRVTQAATTTPSTTASGSQISTRAVGTARVVVAPIRVVTNANGTVTVTNTTSTPPMIITNHK